MLFDSDANDASGTDDEPADSEAAERARKLAAGAEGESVTADRLRGEEKYFPNALQYLHSDQQPHHLLLLTTSAATTAFDVVYPENPSSVCPTSLGADDGGVVVLTEEAVLVVIDGDVFEMPYASLDATRIVDQEVTMTANGREYYCRTADSADDTEVSAAYDYLRRRVRERHT